MGVATTYLSYTHKAITIYLSIYIDCFFVDSRIGHPSDAASDTRAMQVGSEGREQWTLPPK